MSKKYPASINVLISTDEVKALDHTRLKYSIERKIDQIDEISKSANEVGNELTQKYEEYIIKHEIVIRFGIQGYDDDPRPLWEFAENRKWGRHLMNEMPYSILFLEPQSCLLLGLLCLNGYKSKQFGGFIPDFNSRYSNTFFSLLKKSFSRVVREYENMEVGDSSDSSERATLLSVYAEIKRQSISSQFEEMKQTIDKKSRERWWRFLKPKKDGRSDPQRVEENNIYPPENNPKQSKDYFNKVRKCLGCNAELSESQIHCPECGSDHFIWESRDENGLTN